MDTADLFEIEVRHKKDHIKISQFTKFEVLSLDCNHVEIGKNRYFICIWGTPFQN